MTTLGRRCCRHEVIFFGPFAVFFVRSSHDERLVRTFLLLKLMLISLVSGGRKEEEERRNKEEGFCSLFQPAEISIVVLLSVCLCSLPYESLHMFGFETCSCIKREYNENEEKYLIAINSILMFLRVICVT
ncbi:hypothetical protein HU200_058288 [Digitaria exilis]|uniref:Uncharacterized protein n=1 Tax=Digitaria exilis TaxID=1010633 RepID=A0A835A9S0_9POAL|nr:hypothetical protein HU200_058288 [Digitaria exilis]